LSNNRKYVYVRGSRKHKKGPSPLIPIFIIAIGIIGAAGFLVYSLFFGPDNSDEIARQEPNMEEINFFDHHDNSHLTAGRMYVTINGEIITAHTAPTFIEGRLHLPADFLRAHVDRYIFWEHDSNRLTITNPDEVMRFNPDADTYTSNWQPRPLADPIREIAGMAYMSADMVMERYPVTIVHQEEYNFVILDLHRYQRLIYQVVEAVFEDDEPQEYHEEDFFIPLRFGPGDQQPIIARLNYGDRVVNLGAAPREEEEEIFYRVQAENGLIGYVEAQNLNFMERISPIPHIEMRRPVTRPSFDGPINMVWHLVTSHAAAANSVNWSTMQGVNAISPTWLYFCRPSMDGTIINFGNREYVQWARANGMEVWPMISDAFFGPEGVEVFTNEAARLALMDAEIRDYVIVQIMDMVIRYNWDGINIDYEAVLPPEGEHFIQFLRELSVPMREAGAVLSVAVFSPVDGNLWWNYPEIAMATDFVVIMAYDEHYRTINTPGSASSFPFVQYAVTKMLDIGVPARQIVMGLPTYMRVWTEQFNLSTGEWELLPGGPGGQPLPEFYPHRRVRDVGMDFGRNIMVDLGGEFIWDYTTRQYVSTVYFTHGETELRTSAWLNCLRSTEEKLSLYTRHNLGGVAWWRKGLELPALWNMADDIIN
jgi:spore germination protein YaaH